MKNLSQTFSSHKSLLLIVSVFAASGYLLYLSEFVAGGVILVLAFTALFLPLHPQTSADSDDAVTKDLQKVVNNASEGLLESRVVHIPKQHPLSQVAWGINNLLDQMEAFMRETSTAIQAASNGNDFRHMQIEGLKGSFAATCHPINEAVEAIALSRKVQYSGELKQIFEKNSGGISKWFRLMGTSKNTF
jgi:hypothetical protein